MAKEKKPVYNGYDEAYVTGKELKEIFKDSFYTGGRHHTTVYALPIPILLELVGVHNDTTYRVFIMIYAFYIDFFSHFAKDITDGIATYGEFCRKYDVRVPVIFKMKNREQVAGSHFQPLPVKELRASFDILRSNPHIKLT